MYTVAAFDFETKCIYANTRSFIIKIVIMLQLSKLEAQAKKLKSQLVEAETSGMQLKDQLTQSVRHMSSCWNRS
jgi:hypothetical protein